MLRWNKLLLNDGDPRAFDERIEPTDAQKKYLEDCRIKIRECVREGIRVASVTRLGLKRQVIARFRLQGSWSYHTCVQRAHGSQEMDLDYGVYLPVELFEDRSPRVAARAYFDLVEGLLDALCKIEGWTLDRSKDTCIRLKVARWAHIDVPLYAAPEHIFLTIQERALKAGEMEFVEAIELSESFWEEMRDIHLALRDGTWKPSDPAAVTRWWRDLIAEHGEQLRRVCRYMKAWRDLWWPTGGPSSVAVMIGIAQGFVPQPRRDDLAVRLAAERLAEALRGELREPAIDGGKEDFNNLSAAERRAAAERARELATSLASLRQYGLTLRRDALEKIRAEFGDRIPDLIDWIEGDGGAEVRATAAAVVAPPAVRSTESG